MDGTAQSGCACINQIAAVEHNMDFLKELFTKPLSFEEFSAAVTSKGIKLADLSSGEYVAKGKLTEATDKAKALTDKVSAYEKTIGELKAAAGDADGLKGRIAELEKTIADRDAAEKAEFQSTPSAGRATLSARRTWSTTAFQSTPSAGRATEIVPVNNIETNISIHALRGEGDCR